MKHPQINPETIKRAAEALQNFAQATEIKTLKSKKNLTTEEALEHLLSSKQLWQKTGIPFPRQRYYKHLNKKGKNLSLSKKIELLTKAGFQLKITCSFSPQ